MSSDADINDSELDNYYVISKYSSFSISLISLFSAFCIFYLYITRHYLRTFAFKMVVFLQISDSLLSFSIILQIFNPTSNPHLCKFQAYTMNYGILSSFLWTVCISTSIYFSAKGKLNDFERVEKIFIILCFGFPFIWSFIPLILGDYGVSGNWCWIPTDQNSLEIQLVIIFELYFFMWASMIYNSIIITLTIIYFRKIEKILGVTIDEGLRKIIYFPICQFIIWMVPSIIRIMQLCGYSWKGFFIIRGIVVSLNGVANTILYAINNNIKEDLQKSFQNLLA